MIGGKQAMTYYAPKVGVGINSIEYIYNFMEKEELKTIQFLNESFKMETCSIEKPILKRAIKKIETETGTHYLSGEEILVNGSFVNSNEIKIGDKIASYVRQATFSTMRDLNKNKNQAIEDISSTYYMGMFIGLVYAFGGISKHKIVFSLFEKNIKTIKGKFISLEETIIKLISFVGFDSYRILPDKDKFGNILHRYEIMLNLKTSKYINVLFNKYVNILKNKLYLLNFISNRDFMEGFLDAIIDKTNLLYKHTDANIIKQIYVLSNMLGVDSILKKEKGFYSLEFKEHFENEFYFGSNYKTVLNVENEDGYCYNIIKSSDNLVPIITSSKCFLKGIKSS